MQPATARVAAMLTQEREVDAWLEGGTASNEIGQQQGGQSQDCHGPAKLLNPCQFVQYATAVEAWKQVQEYLSGTIGRAVAGQAPLLLSIALPFQVGTQVVDAQTRTSIISNTPYHTPFSIGTALAHFDTVHIKSIHDFTDGL